MNLLWMTHHCKLAHSNDVDICWCESLAMYVMKCVHPPIAVGLIKVWCCDCVCRGVLWNQCTCMTVHICGVCFCIGTAWVH